MKFLFDARQETMYPLAKEGFSGGSQTYIRAITERLAARGHKVHIIAPDLEIDEQRGDNLYYWPSAYFPHDADVAVMQMHARPDPEYQAPIAVLMTSCVDPWLGPNHEFAKSFDCIPVFSEKHKELLCKMRPVSAEKCYVTGLGVDPFDYSVYSYADGEKQIEHISTREWLDHFKIPGRMFYANDPARGLFYVLDIFDVVKKHVPEATLHVAYDFDTQLSWRRWEHSHMAQMLLECGVRLATTPGIVNLGALTRNQVISEELEAQVHCMPSNPPGIGTQTHGITQMECAAAGCALVLSDIEAFPEVFGNAAIVLPVIGQYLPATEKRVMAEDYAAVVVELMTDPERWQQASQSARALAEQNTWDRVVDNWESMLLDVSSKLEQSNV